MASLGEKVGRAIGRRHDNSNIYTETVGFRKAVCPTISILLLEFCSSICTTCLVGVVNFLVLEYFSSSRPCWNVHHSYGILHLYIYMALSREPKQIHKDTLFYLCASLRVSNETDACATCVCAGSLSQFVFLTIIEIRLCRLSLPWVGR